MRAPGSSRTTSAEFSDTTACGGYARSLVGGCARISVIYFGFFDLLNDLTFVSRFVQKDDYGRPQDKY